MLSSLFDVRPIYIKVFENKFEFRLCDGKNITVTIRANEPFSSTRLLVGNFNIAETLILDGVREISTISLFILSRNILIHAIDKSDGGLSQVEDRTLRELALSIGGKDIVVWCGKPLSDIEVEGMFKGK